MTGQTFLLLAVGMFSIGLYGLMIRKDLIGLLLSVELMANAANVALVAFSYLHQGSFGQIFALFAMALTVVEVGAGLALLLLLYRIKRDVTVGAIQELSR